MCPITRTGGAICACTSARRRGWGRPTRCSKRRTASRQQGVDVVVGFVETHGRIGTEALVAGLEVIPRSTITYKGVTVEEMDTDAILARHPRVALVDELAHTNAPGSPRAKRYEDVQVLLRGGHQCHLHAEYPASGEPARCRRRHHGRAAARNDPR